MYDSSRMSAWTSDLTQRRRLGLSCLALLPFAAICAAADTGPAQLDVYVSTGDNHFLGSSLPIDSPASIGATFDLFQNVNHARRIYWRGLEEACWVSTMQARPENLRYHSLWTWMQWLYAHVNPDDLAVKAAHARGMEIWGVGTLWDWGSPADTPTFGDYPFPFESKLKLAHPEWAAMDKHGVRRQGGPIELAYPEARKALVDLHVQETLKAGYDGIIFLTYAENYSMRFQDEFGYSDPIIDDFKKLHRVDLRTEGFKRGASREDWLRLRGTYVTAYLRELHAALKAHGKKLGMIINGNDSHSSLPWNVPELTKTAGSQYMDVETWVREGLVDNLTVYGNCSGAAQMKTTEDLLFLCRQTGIEVSFMTSSPFAPGRQSLYDQKAACVLAVSDDAQHVARGFVPEQTLDALKGEDVWKRLKALDQVIEGKLTAPMEDLAPLVHSENLIERRMALQALGRSKALEVLAPIEPALLDEENGVRCAAALALGDLRSPHALHPLLESVEAHGSHMLVECAIIALRKLNPLPANDLAEAVKTSKNATVRMVAMRALMPFATVEQMPVIRAAMNDADRFTAYAATEAMGNIRKTNGNIFPLIDQLCKGDPALSARAAVSLGVLAARNDPVLATQRTNMLAALKLDFERFGDGSTRDDSDWGWRPVGNALRAFGDEGEAVLRSLRDQRQDMRLAELAWRSLDLHQQPNTFSEVSEKENEEAYARRPRVDDALAKNKTTPAVGRQLHVEPASGSDANDGVATPLKTITRAIRIAAPGDTIHLAPALYHESADLTLKHGELGRPITLDGHGAVLDGSDPVTSKEWESLGNGLYRKQHLIKRIDDAILVRFFFLWNGRMNHMGRTSKGTKAPFKKVADLQQDEWTYVPEEDVFYVRIDPKQDLDSANIRYPFRSSGVIESISGSHLTVRNVISSHVYNDGFNIHGMTRDCHFENIASIECGDDGFSAHDDCECLIDGFVSIGNSTGLADAVSSVTRYKNVFIKECLGVDLLFIGENAHSMENVLVESSAEHAISIGLSGLSFLPDCKCPVAFKNTLVRRTSKPQEARISRGGVMTADHSTFIGITFQPGNGSAVEMHQCIVTGSPKPDIMIAKEAKWTGAGNLYDLGSLRVDKTSFTAGSFAEFQKLIGGETGSKWEDNPASGTAGAGAAEASLAPLANKGAAVLKQWQTLESR